MGKSYCYLIHRVQTLKKWILASSSPKHADCSNSTHKAVTIPMFCTGASEGLTGQAKLSGGESHVTGN